MPFKSKLTDEQIDRLGDMRDSKALDRVGLLGDSTPAFLRWAAKHDSEAVNNLIDKWQGKAEDYTFNQVGNEWAAQVKEERENG